MSAQIFIFLGFFNSVDVLEVFIPAVIQQQYWNVFEDVYCFRHFWIGQVPGVGLSVYLGC